MFSTSLKSEFETPFKAVLRLMLHHSWFCYLKELCYSRSRGFSLVKHAARPTCLVWFALESYFSLQDHGMFCSP